MDANNNMRSQNADSALPPGAWLRRVRTERSIQPEQVCAHLGITRHRLQMLEDDDYCRLPAEVYVRGWIRRYCSMLDLSAEPVLRNFEHQQALLREEKAQRQRRLMQRRQQRTRRVAAVAGVALVVLAAVGWLAGTSPRGVVEESVMAAADTSQDVEAPVASMPRELLGQTQVDETELSQLEVRFSSDSWVEVLDAAGNILVADLKQADEVLLLEGVPPFEVYVANAPAVQLRYRGEVLELAMSPNDQGVRTLIGADPVEPVNQPDES